MTVEEVREEVARIATLADDDETAHQAEDALMRAVLEAIVAGAQNAPELAAEALKTSEISFCRWYA